jgi:hypothetical protein
MARPEPTHNSPERRLETSSCFLCYGADPSFSDLKFERVDYFYDACLDLSPSRLSPSPSSYQRSQNTKLRQQQLDA